MGQFFTAFGAGLMSFFSPCVLPLLPGYLSMLSGFSAGEIMKGEAGVSVRKVTARAFIFICGFTLAFAFMGAAASSIGGLFYDHKALLLKVFGVLLFLMGAHMSALFNLNFLNYEKRFSMRGHGSGNWGAFLMGFAFALGWSPCIGPILGLILGMAAVAGTAAKGVALLVTYSAGLALPLLISALLTAEFFAFMARWRGAMRWIEMAAGIIMMLLGVLLFFDRLMLVD